MNSIDSENIGEFIAIERVSARLSRSKLSFLADVSEYNIEHYENRRSQPSFDTANKLLSALGYEIVIRKKVQNEEKDIVHRVCRK